MVIVDTHTHFGVENSIKIFDGASKEAFLAHADRVGCTYMIQSGISFLKQRPEFTDFDEKCRELYEWSNGRVVSMVVYNPIYAEECLELLDKYHDRPYIVGIKIHPSNNSVWADDESYRPVWEKADQYHLPIMAHTWSLTSNPKQKYATPDRFEKYIREYPNVNFIFGHSGGRTPGIREAAAIGAKYKNAYFDLAGDIYNRKLIEYLVSTVGADRVLLASDLGWFELSVPMGMVLGADITSEEKELILGGNAMRLFGLEE